MLLLFCFVLLWQNVFVGWHHLKEINFIYEILHFILAFCIHSAILIILMCLFHIDDHHQLSEWIQGLFLKPSDHATPQPPALSSYLQRSASLNVHVLSFYVMKLPSLFSSFSHFSWNLPSSILYSTPPCLIVWPNQHAA